MQPNPVLPVLPAREEDSEDTLEMQPRPMNSTEMIRAYRDGTPWPDGLIFAREPRAVGMGEQKIKCDASVSEAVLEDRG